MSETNKAIEVMPVGPIPRMPVDIAEAVLKVMEAVGYVRKMGRNKDHGYFFAAIGDVLAKVQPAMVDAGLVIVQREGKWTWLNDGKILAITYSFTLHLITGTTWDCDIQKTGIARFESKTGGIDDKAVNKCSSAARKYLQLELFQIPTGDLPEADDDGDSRLGRREAPQEDNGMSHQTEDDRITDITKKEAARNWVDSAKIEVAQLAPATELDKFELYYAETLDKLFLTDDRLHQELMDAIAMRKKDLAA